MRYIGKIATVSLLSLVTGMYATQAKADDRDGTIERFVCVREGSDDGRLQSNFVQLKGVNANHGFGGGNWALNLSDGVKTSDLGRETYAGGTVTFMPQKRENVLEIDFKPDNIPLGSVDVDICVQGPKGPGYVKTGFSTMTVSKLSNGWYKASEDLDSFNGFFAGSI